MKLTEHLFFYPERGMFGCNTYVIKDKQNVIIDPGFGLHLEGLVKEMRKDGIEPKDIDLITNTHLHIDHCGGNQAFKDLSAAKIVIHPLHKEYYHLNIVELPKLIMSLFGSEVEFEGFQEDSLLDANTFSSGEMEFELLHTPGHSPDSICFYSKKEKMLICGDVVFAQSTGRVDFPGGNAGEIKRSIGRLSKLGIEYLLPGHLNIVKGKTANEKNFVFVREYVFPWLA
jgi:hydroxyacylglutathione hydrolase